MNRSSLFFSLAILLLLLIPTPLGKLIVNLAGGILFISFLIPIFIAGIAWISWKQLESNLKKCKVCGASFSKDLNQCPICGSSETIETAKEGNNNTNLPASSITIDISAEEAE